MVTDAYCFTGSITSVLSLRQAIIYMSICRGFVHTFALSSDYNAMCCVRCDGSRAYTCTCTNIWIVSVMSLRVIRLPLTCYPRSDVLLYITDCNNIYIYIYANAQILPLL
jgi:hypothetical protein